MSDASPSTTLHVLEAGHVGVCLDGLPYRERANANLIDLIVFLLRIYVICAGEPSITLRVTQRQFCVYNYIAPKEVQYRCVLLLSFNQVLFW